MSNLDDERANFIFQFVIRVILIPAIVGLIIVSVVLINKLN